MSTIHPHATPGRPARGPLAVAALAIAATLAAAPAPARAAEPQLAVPYQDLDLETDAGARALYARITAAARRVCPASDARDLHRSRAARACQADAVARAVASVGSARLAAIDAGRRERARAG